MAKKNEVVKTKSAEVVPEELLKEIEGISLEGDFDIPSGETIFPFTKLMQALSPEVQDEDIDVKIGDVINNQDKSKLSGSYFVPLKFFQEYVIWDTAGKQMLARTQNPDENFVSIITEQNDVSDDIARGMLWKYKTIYILAWLIVEKYPVLIPCSRTSYKSGVNVYRTCRLRGNKMLISVFKIGSKKQTTDKHNYFILQFTPSGYVKKKLILQQVLEAHNNFKHIKLYDLVPVLDDTPKEQGKEIAEKVIDIVENDINNEEVIDADF